MRVLVRPTDAVTPQRVVCLFGAGLIGHALTVTLVRQFGFEVQEHPYDWRDATVRAGQRSAIQTLISSYLSASETEVAIVWAAGARGFGATDAEMAEEAVCHAEVIDLARSVSNKARTTFHQVSSAGGLFEGQVACTSDTVPDPRRPYGLAKMRQEAAVRKLPQSLIYRASSVYGYNRRARSGLVPTLIRNALRGTQTRIAGSLTTLRDYVFVEDVARFIAMRIMSTGSANHETALLAQFRPAAIFEIIAHVESVLGRPLHLMVDKQPANALDTSFLPSAAPIGWRATGLTEGIARVHMQIRQDLAVAGRVAA